MKPVKLSYSRLLYFLSCRRKFYYKYIAKMEENKFNFNFFVGNVCHGGIASIYKLKEFNTIEILKVFSNEFEKVKKEYFLGSIEIQHILDYKHKILAMLEGYYTKFKRDIEVSDSLAIEFNIEYEFMKDVLIKSKVDNIININEDIMIHEVKTPAILTTDYVLSVRNDLQTTIYYYLYNRVCEAHDLPPATGIVYDIVKKPGIRQKKNETTNQYKARIKNYYAIGSDAYHREKISKPLRSEAGLFNTIASIAQFIKDTGDEEVKYFTNDTHCNVYRRCEYYARCYGVLCGNYTQLT